MIYTTVSCSGCAFGYSKFLSVSTAARLDELKRMRRRLKAATRRTCADNVHAVLGDEIAAIDRRIKKLEGV